MSLIKYLTLFAFLSTSLATADSKSVLFGFNQNWSQMPTLNEKLIKQITLLKPQILRYPGGTVTHSWDWKKGEIKTRKPIAKHHIEEVKKLYDATNADFVFVLDIVNSAVEDQISMLKKIESLKVPIKYLELGNELYAKDDVYIKKFKTGVEYAEESKKWIEKLKAEFPKVQISTLLLGRDVLSKNKRSYDWNKLVIDNTKNEVDAFVYHLYIADGEDFEKTKKRFLKVMEKSKTESKDLWITEYGNQNPVKSKNYLKDLEQLTKFLKKLNHVKIVMSHQIISKNMNKIDVDSLEFIDEGKLFLNFK